MSRAASTTTIEDAGGCSVSEIMQADQSHERLGIWGTAVADGRASDCLTVKPDMVNGLGAVSR